MSQPEGQPIPLDAIQGSYNPMLKLRTKLVGPTMQHESTVTQHKEAIKDLEMQIHEHEMAITLEGIMFNDQIEPTVRELLPFQVDLAITTLNEAAALQQETESQVVEGIRQVFVAEEIFDWLMTTIPLYDETKTQLNQMMVGLKSTGAEVFYITPLDDDEFYYSDKDANIFTASVMLTDAKGLIRFGLFLEYEHNDDLNELGEEPFTIDTSSDYDDEQLPEEYSFDVDALEDNFEKWGKETPVEDQLRLMFLLIYAARVSIAQSNDASE